MGMGYQGFATVDGNLVLVTGSSVNIVIEPIVSQAALGLGWWNAATSTHYANAALRYEGNIDFDFQASDNVWNAIGQWGVYKRLYPKNVIMSPDGQKKFSYIGAVASGDPGYSGAWCSRLSFSAAQGSPVRVSSTLLAIHRATADAGQTTGFWNQKTGFAGQTGDYSATFSGSNPLNPSSNNQDPIPFWKTNARVIDTQSYSPCVTGSTSAFTDASNTFTVEWNVEVNNNTTALYTCNNLSTTEGGSTFGLPNAILVGPMDVTGQGTFFNHNGVENIIGRTAEHTGFQVIITPTNIIELPAVMISSDNYPIQGITAPVNRTYQFRGFGGKITGTTVLPPCIMTTSAGSYGTAP